MKEHECTVLPLVDLPLCRRQGVWSLFLRSGSPVQVGELSLPWPTAREGAQGRVVTSFLVRSVPLKSLYALGKAFSIFRPFVTHITSLQSSLACRPDSRPTREKAGEDNDDDQKVGSVRRSSRVANTATPEPLRQKDSVWVSIGTTGHI